MIAAQCDAFFIASDLTVCPALRSWERGSDYQVASPRSLGFKEQVQDLRLGFPAVYSTQPACFDAVDGVERIENRESTLASASFFAGGRLMWAFDQRITFTKLFVVQT